MVDSGTAAGLNIFPIFPPILQLNGQISALSTARRHGLRANLSQDSVPVLWKAFQHEYAS